MAARLEWSLNNTLGAPRDSTCLPKGVDSFGAANVARSKGDVQDEKDNRQTHRHEHDAKAWTGSNEIPQRKIIPLANVVD